MTIINLRGTSGSGKTTLVKRLGANHARKVARFHGWPTSNEALSAAAEGRKQPLYYRWTLSNGSRLAVLGHYEVACGGCDTLTAKFGLDGIYELVDHFHSLGDHVLYEGLVVTSDFKRVLERKDNGINVIELDTSMEDCVAGIQSRRDARGDIREVNPKNTLSKARAVLSQRPHFRNAEVPLYILNRDDAYDKVVELLGLDPAAARIGERVA